MSEFSPLVQAALDSVRVHEKKLLEVAHRLMTAAGGQMYVFDTFAIATLNRAVAISAGFATLMAARNMVAAGPLVRVHLDTALRYHASHIVLDWNEFAGEVLNGVEIRKMKDKDGNKLTDRHLAESLDKKEPGVLEIYEKASGFVHLSPEHISCSLTGVKDKENSIVGIQVSAIDRPLSDDFYITACNSIVFTSTLIVKLIESWIEYKEKHCAPPP